MPNHPLFYPLNDDKAGDYRDRVQIALAIAEPTLLRSLLTQCIPPITEAHLVGSIKTEVGIPAGAHHYADGILNFEAIHCVLADPAHPIELQPANGGWTTESRELARLTRHESELQTLTQNLPLAPTISLLAESGFYPNQIENILRLPHDAWHKSWWYALDLNREFTLPFLRHIRTLRYPDGTLTVQFKDYFEQDKPPCFVCQNQNVLIVVKPDQQGFGETLKQINLQREVLGIRQVILICNTIAELEAQAFINQGISIYPAAEVTLPLQANCTHCGRQECPMNGVEGRIALCYGYLPQSEFVS
jgi:bacterioferritin-associated ferredoxin